MTIHLIFKDNFKTFMRFDTVEDALAEMQKYDDEYFVAISNEENILTIAQFKERFKNI